MKNLLWVALGGGSGAVCRYLLGLAVMRFGAGSATFPWGTWIVNMLGCFLIGLAFNLKGELRLLLVVGFLGGFTTYSSFSLDTLQLLKSHPGLAILNVGSQVILGLLAVWAGMTLRGEV